MLSAGALLYAIGEYNDASAFLGAAHSGFDAWHYTPKATPYCAAYAYVLLCELRRRASAARSGGLNCGETASCVARLRHLLLDPLAEAPPSPRTAPLAEVRSIATEELLDMLRESVGLAEAALGPAHVFTVQLHLEYALAAYGMLAEPTVGESRASERIVLDGADAQGDGASRARSGARAAAVTQWLMRPEQMSGATVGADTDSASPIPAWLAHWQTACGSLLYAGRSMARQRAFRTAADDATFAWDEIALWGNAPDDADEVQASVAQSDKTNDASVGMSDPSQIVRTQSNRQLAAQAFVAMEQRQRSDVELWRQFPEHVAVAETPSLGAMELLWRPTAIIHAHETQHALQCVALVQEARRYALSFGWPGGRHDDAEEPTSSPARSALRMLAGHMEGALAAMRVDLRLWSREAVADQLDASAVYATRFSLVAARHAMALVDAATCVTDRRALAPVEWEPYDAVDDLPRALACRLIARAHRVVNSNLFSRALDAAARATAGVESDISHDGGISARLTIPLLLSKLRVGVERARFMSLGASGIDGGEFRALTRAHAVGSPGEPILARLAGPRSGPERMFANLYECTMAWGEVSSLRNLWDEVRTRIREPAVPDLDTDASAGARTYSPAEVHLLILRARCSGEMGLALLEKARRNALYGAPEQTDVDNDATDTEDDAMGDAMGDAMRVDAEQRTAELQFAASLLEQAGEVLWALRDDIASTCRQPSRAWLAGPNEDQPEAIKDIVQSCSGFLHLLPVMHDTDTLEACALLDASRYYGAAYMCFRDAERLVGIPLEVSTNGGAMVTTYIARSVALARRAKEAVSAGAAGAVGRFDLGSADAQYVVSLRWMSEWLGVSIAQVPKSTVAPAVLPEAADSLSAPAARSVARQVALRQYVEALESSAVHTRANLPAPLSVVRAATAARFGIEAAVHGAGTPRVAEYGEGLYASIAAVPPLTLHAGIALIELGIEMCTHGDEALAIGVSTPPGSGSLDMPLDVLALAMTSLSKATQAARNRAGAAGALDPSSIEFQLQRARVVYGIALSKCGYPEGSNRALVDSVPLYEAMVKKRFSGMSVEGDGGTGQGLMDVLFRAKESVVSNDKEIASLRSQRMNLEEMLALERKVNDGGGVELGSALTKAKLSGVLVSLGEVSRAKALLNECGRLLTDAGDPHASEVEAVSERIKVWDRAAPLVASGDAL